METTIAAWQQDLTTNSDRSGTTVTQYVRDAHRCAAWLVAEERATVPSDITLQDAKDYRDHLVRTRRAPATVNRALVSLALFLDWAGRRADNPFRRIARVEQVPAGPQALTRLEWHALRRSAEREAGRDQGLALALVCLMRYAGPRVAEVAALQLADVPLSARRGLLIVRRGKGLKHREVPLVLEAREPLEAYLAQRKHRADHWRQKARLAGYPPPAWATWPDGHLFLGQRGPLTVRGIREIVAKLGQAAKLDRPLSPHDLRHTFAKALLDPGAYGLERPAAPLTAVQELLGHADVATTALYTRASATDLARIMGEADPPER